MVGGCEVGWIEGWVDGWMDGWMDGWVDEWMGGWTGEWTKESTVNLNPQDLTVVRSSDVFGGEGFELVARRWSGVRTGPDWTGLHGTIQDHTRPDWSGVEWSGVEWSGVKWSGVEWSGVEWSGVEWSGVESEIGCNTGVTESRQNLLLSVNTAR